MNDNQISQQIVDAAVVIFAATLSGVMPGAGTPRFDTVRMPKLRRQEQSEPVRIRLPASRSGDRRQRKDFWHCV
jgi:hypothetical protein